MSLNRYLRFDSEKAIEMILYVAARLPQPSRFYIAKIFYFADQQHLNDYGRFLCDDQYVAMKNGPVPSNIYDILKGVAGEARATDHAKASLSVEGRTVTGLRAPMLDQLSPSEIECLDAAIATYGACKFGELSEKSHDSAWQSADENDFISVEDLLNLTQKPAQTREYWLGQRI